MQESNICAFNISLHKALFFITKRYANLVEIRVNQRKLSNLLMPLLSTLSLTAPSRCNSNSSRVCLSAATTFFTLSTETKKRVEEK